MTEDEGIAENEAAHTVEAADVGDTDEATSRRRWNPEGNEEAAAALRTLMVRPWLVATRDDEVMAVIRRNLKHVEGTVARLAWVLVVERDFIRLRKSPPPRREAWSRSGPTPLQASWFFLLVAGAETLPARVGFSQLIAATRAAAAEAGIPSTNDVDERRAIARSFKMLAERGVFDELDGNVEEFIDDEEAVVVVAIHHTRLAQTIANFGASDPAAAPLEWLREVEREPEAARRMRRRLVDDAVVHASDLDEAEAEWLSRRVRSDDGGPLAKAFGLTLERRAEGAAFVVPEDAFRYPHELQLSFPGTGTVAHAALLACDLCGRVGTETVDGASAHGPGWRAVEEGMVVAHFAEVAPGYAANHTWKAEFAEHPDVLATKVFDMLSALDLVRASPTGTWWFSPVTGRWAASSMRTSASARDEKS